MKMTSSRWTVSVDNCSAVHADIYRRYPANKEAKPFNFLSVILNTDYMLNMNQQIAVWPDCLKVINMSKTLFYTTIQSHYAGP